MHTASRVLTASGPLLAALAVLLAASLAAGQSLQTGQALHGVVLDETGLPLPGAQVELRREDTSVASLVTAGDGTFAFPEINPTDTLEVSLDGFETARIPAAQGQRIVLHVAHATEHTEVTASILTSSGASMERLGSTMTAPLAQRLPTRQPRILQSLPLLPSVVKGPEGLLHIGGTRPHESSLWIDGFDVTDPVSGTTAIDLPVESVKGMAVLRDPIASTFSGALGSLASIETTPGGDSFKGGVQGFIPRPRLSRLGLGKIEAFFPRVYASGRLGRRAAFFASSEFNFERVPVPGVTTRSGRPSVGTTGVTSFVRLDVRASERQTVTLEGLFVPAQTRFAGLSPLRPAETTPPVETQDVFTGFIDRIVFGPSDVLTFRVGLMGHGTRIDAQRTGPAVLRPDGWSQNWFATGDEWGTRREASVTWDRAGVSAWGTHTFSLSTDLHRRAMQGSVARESIQIRDASDRLARLIRFRAVGRIEAHDLTAGLGLRDLWEVDPRLQVDLDVRVDANSVSGQPVASPRIGLRYLVERSGRTTLKASAGRFVGIAPLGALAFDQLPVRMETTFDRTTRAAVQSIALTPVLTRLDLPRADGLALEIERQIRPRLDLQVAVRQRRGFLLPTVDVPVAGGPTRLASTGTSLYREFEVSLRQAWRNDAQLFLSYVRSGSRGDLNDFGTLYTNLQAVYLEPGGTVTLPGDVPHRVRGWATAGLPWRIVVSPSVEWRTGFPYSVQDVYRHYVGAPNSARFPNYFAVDDTIFKSFDIKRRTLDLGLQFFNVTSHFNPRDVITVAGTPRFGELTNSFGATVGGYMQIRW